MRTFNKTLTYIILLKNMTGYVFVAFQIKCCIILHNKENTVAYLICCLIMFWENTLDMFATCSQVSINSIVFSRFKQMRVFI